MYVIVPPLHLAESIIKNCFLLVGTKTITEITTILFQYIFITNTSWLGKKEKKHQTHSFALI